MDFEIKKTAVSTSECFCESKCEQSVSLDISLPDYCRDVKRILKCITEPGIANISLSGETATLSGVITVRLVYVGEDENIDCYEHVSPLSMSVQIKDIPENTIFKASAKTDYINCRALTQRKISLNGSIGAIVQVFRQGQKELPESVEGGFIETKKKKVKVTNLICQGEKTFDLSETVVMDSSRPDIAKVIRLNCYPRVTSVRAVADKLLVKGELCCKVLYCTEKDNKLQKIQHTMPISQIVDLPGADEKDDISVSLYLRQSVVAVKNDSSGKGRLLEIAARVSAFVKCSQEKEITLIDDCYSTQYEVKGEYSLTEFAEPLLCEERNLTRDKTIDFASGGIKEIIDMWHTDTKCFLSSGEGEIKGNCSFLLCGIYADSEGLLRYSEKNVDFDIQLPFGKDCGNLRFDCQTQITELDFSLLSDGKVKIKGEISLKAEVCGVNSLRVLTNLEIDESMKKKDESSALTLYYSDKGESLWEIARKYNTTVELIKQENSLTGTETSESRMLLIPCV